MKSTYLLLLLLVMEPLQAQQPPIASGEYGIVNLGTLGGPSSEAHAINDRCQIVGWAQTPSNLTHAFLWEDGVMNDLGTLGGNWSSASDILSIATSESRWKSLEV